jgi:hypothetical protein
MVWGGKMRQLSKRPKSQIGANEGMSGGNEECKISIFKEKVMFPESNTWQDSCVNKEVSEGLFYYLESFKHENFMSC